MRDESAERVSRRLQALAHKAVHEVPVQEPAHPEDPIEPKAPAVEAEQFVINLPATDSFPCKEMVNRKTMTIDHFVPDARQATQPPPSQSQVQAPPPPPPPQVGQVRKRQKVVDQPPTGSRDVVTLTPPRPTRGIVIQEPQTQVGPGIASSSQATPTWKPKFLLDGKPLPSTACVQMWKKGEGGRIAQTLATGLLLPDQVHAFKERTEESVGRRLQWHTIAVTLFSSITYHPLYFVAALTSVFVRLLNWPTFWVIV